MSGMLRFSRIPLGAGYFEERTASPSILMADIAGPRLSAASVVNPLSGHEATPQNTGCRFGEYNAGQRTSWSF